MIYEAEVTQRVSHSDYVVHADTSMNSPDLFIAATHTIDMDSAVYEKKELEIGKRYRFDGYANIGVLGGCMMIREVMEV